MSCYGESSWHNGDEEGKPPAPLSHCIGAELVLSLDAWHVSEFIMACLVTFLVQMGSANRFVLALGSKACSKHVLH